MIVLKKKVKFGKSKKWKAKINVVAVDKDWCSFMVIHGDVSTGN